MVAYSIMLMDRVILKKYADNLLKIFFLVFGLADFFGFLPNSLDLFDKVLTSLIIFFFWYQLKPSLFLFGKKNKFLDWSILFAFYVLVVDTFINFIRLINLSDTFVQNIGLVISKFSFLGFGSLLKSIFFFLHNPANASVLSLYSVLIGFSLLILISLYSAMKMTYGDKSVISSFVHVFTKKSSSWKNFADTKGSSVILKFFLSLLVLFSIYQFFFSLVIQWFVVSLDKALLVLAILYAVKDIKGTKSEALNKLGSFDEWLLDFITSLFTNKKFFFLGFGVLLLFHFLSDLATFFLPYVLSFISIDPFYLNYLGSSGVHSHLSISALIALESSTSFFHHLILTSVYSLSAFGLLCIIIFPLVLLYNFIFKFHLRSFLERPITKFFTRLVFFSSVLFFVAPWVSQKVISVSGIQGVDFVTKQISSSFNPIILFALFISLFVLSYIVSLIKRNLHIDRYMVLFIFLTSLSYLGYYVLNYFISSLMYHFSSISYLFSVHQYFGVIVFSFMFLLEFLFYIGGFLLLSYHLTIYFLKDIFLDLFSKRFVFFWTLLVLILPMLILFSSTLNALKIASVLISVLLIFSYSLYKLLGFKEKKDDYLLALVSIISFYQFLLILQLLVFYFNIISLGLFTFLESLFVVFFAFGVTKFFSQKHVFSWISFKRLIIMFLLSLAFGLVFFVLGEPVPALFSTSILVLLPYTLFIAVGEEVLFRGVIYRLAQKSFKPRNALHIQSLIFALVHFMGLSFLVSFFTKDGSMFAVGIVNLVLYFVALYFFAFTAAKFIKKKYNLSLPILFHWLVNLLAISLFYLLH